METKHINIYFMNGPLIYTYYNVPLNLKHNYDELLNPELQGEIWSINKVMEG